MKWFFALLLAATACLAGALLAPRASGVGALLAGASPGSVLMVAMGAALFYGADALRWALILPGRSIGLTLGLRLTSVSYFASSLTPFDLWHLPAIARALEASGVPRAEAEQAIVAKSAVTTLIVALAGLMGLPLALSAPGLSGRALACWFALAPTSVALALVGLWLRAAHLTRRTGLVGRVSRALAGLAPGQALRLVGATALFLASYVLCGLGAAAVAGLPPTLAMASALLGGLAAAYLAPYTPGSAIVAEAVTATLLGGSDAALAAALLLRVACWYAAALAGAIPFVRDARARVGHAQQT